MEKLCIVSGCTRKRGHGRYCWMHIQRIRRARKKGIPLSPEILSAQKLPHPMLGRTGAAHPRWSGGTVTKCGYRLVWVPDRHKQVYEHRYVMEQHLGRLLDDEEVVHHIDHNKLNNDISNLELCSNEHEHQSRFHREDRTIWAKKGAAARWKGHKKVIKTLAEKRKYERDRYARLKATNDPKYQEYLKYQREYAREQRAKKKLLIPTP